MHIYIYIYMYRYINPYLSASVSVSPPLSLWSQGVLDKGAQQCLQLLIKVAYHRLLSVHKGGHS